MASAASMTMQAANVAQPPKFSRYRSVRTKSAVPTSTAPPPPPIPEQPTADLTRTPTRYRRRPQTTAAPALPTSQPPVPPLPRSLLPSNTATVSNGAMQNQTKRTADRKHVSPDRTNMYPTKSNEVTARESERIREKRMSTTSRGLDPRRSYEVAREEARMILEGEYDRLNRMKQAQKQYQLPSGSEAPDMRRRRDIPANSTTKRRVEEGQLKDIPEKVEPVVASSDPVTSPKFRTWVIGGPKQPTSKEEKRKSFIQRAFQQESDPMPQKTPSLPESTHHSQPSRTQPLPSQNKITPEPPSEAVRVFDAPVSAVNAGDRRVEVKCNQASITLPVNPSTTVKDLLNSASICMSEQIDPKTAIILESFSQLGLERPLRRYEKIRDVMNSWDNDTQNHLTIMGTTECAAVGLELKDVPSAAPVDVSVQMYHSLKPGKWEKKWIKLREDGQVTVSKSQEGLDGSNICHLSDFDVYSPTRKQAKKLKSPKKICFAVKSQQKSAMFLNGENFVHFFCSNDNDVATRWYNAVQSWRSWYLVNVLGEGDHKPKRFSTVRDSQRRPSTAQSKDSIPYQLGSFKPLLDFADFRLSMDEFADSAKSNTASDHRMSKSSFDYGGVRGSLDFQAGNSRSSPRNTMPPSSFPRKMTLESVPNMDTQPFTGGGLLARSASRRSQGGNPSGRGVQGAKGKPLVDLHPTSEFTDGSLLRKMEAWAIQNGAAEPKIDREKRIEANIRVGEGYDE